MVGFKLKPLSMAVVLAIRKVKKPSHVQRYITSIHAAAGAYFALSEPIVIAAGEDFEIEFYGYVKQTVTSNEPFIGSMGSLNSFTIFQNSSADGIVTVQFPKIGGSSSYLSVNGIYEGVNTIVLKRLGNTVILSVGNKEANISNDNLLSEIIVNSVGKWNALLFTGELYDVKVWVGGDRNTGTLVGDYPIDEDWTQGNVVRNRAAVLGGELWVNPTLGSQWTDNGDGSYTLAGNGVYSDMFVDVPENGKSYLATFDYTSDEEIGMRIDSSTNGVQPEKLKGSGTANVLLIANDSGSTRIGFARSNSGEVVNATISNISVREIPSGYPYALAINVTQDDAEKFTKVDSGANWLGKYLWSHSVDYFVEQVQSVIDYQGVVGQHLIKTDSAATGVKEIDLTTNFVEGEIYRVSYTIVENRAGLLNFSDFGVMPSTVGKHEVDMLALHNVTNAYIKRQGGATDIVIRDISVKHLIPIAQGGA